MKTAALLTYEEVSARLSVKPTLVVKWVERKLIPHIRLGARTVRFREDEIETWLEARSVGASSRV